MQPAPLRSFLPMHHRRHRGPHRQMRFVLSMLFCGSISLRSYRPKPCSNSPPLVLVFSSSPLLPPLFFRPLRFAAPTQVDTPSRCFHGLSVVLLRIGKVLGQNLRNKRHTTDISPVPTKADRAMEYIVMERRAAIPTANCVSECHPA